MTCPRCGGGLGTELFEAFTVARCPRCGGVCRAHGAWLDAGELRAIRRFVRAGGAVRHRRRTATSPTQSLDLPPVIPTHATTYDSLIDVLAGIPDPWDVPPRRTAAAWFLRAAVLALCGAGLVAIAIWSPDRGRRGLAGLAGVGGYLLIASVVAAGRAIEQRRRERDAERPSRAPR